MIIPIGHDEDGVRRLPWVTFAVIGLCVLVFLVSKPSEWETQAGADELWTMLDYYWEHPYLELSAPFDELADGMWDEDLIAEVQDTMAPPGDPAQLAAEQRRLDELCERALEAMGVETYVNWGLVPDELSPVTLISHMFLHAGWLHLFGNLLILYLAGPFIEDVWGRPIFAGFYLAAGVFAALAQVARFPDSTVPLIGASGAIAGVMGAFLVRYWHTPIRFFYIFGLIIRGTFKAPAWVMLPLWFGMQVFFAMLTDSLTNGEGGGVAFWAHIGGFVFGVGTALGLRHWQVEQRFVASAIEAKVQRTVVDNDAVEQALAAHARGRADEARQHLCALIAREPANEAAVLALWTITGEDQDPGTPAVAMVALVESELRRGNVESALAHWTELTQRVPHPPGGAEFFVRLAQTLARHGQSGEAAQLLRRAMLEAGSGMSAPLAMRIARAAREIDPQVARGAARLLLIQPQLEPAERQFAERLLGDLG